MPHLRRLVTLIVALGLGWSSRADAQFDPQWAFNGAPQAATLHSSYVLQQLAFDSAHRLAQSGGKGKASSRRAATSTITAGKAAMAHKLAEAYPAARRAEAEQLFGQLLASYKQLERSLALSPGDAAGAVALLVVASYEAYAETSVDPSVYQPVIAQLRGAIAASPEFGKATAAERRALYEETAILGMFVALVRAELVKRPDPTTAGNLRDAAKRYLVELVKRDPDTLEITPAGITAR